MAGAAAPVRLVKLRKGRLRRSSQRGPFQGRNPGRSLLSGAAPGAAGARRGAALPSGPADILHGGATPAPAPLRSGTRSPDRRCSTSHPRRLLIDGAGVAARSRLSAAAGADCGKFAEEMLMACTIVHYLCGEGLRVERGRVVVALRDCTTGRGGSRPRSALGCCSGLRCRGRHGRHRLAGQHEREQGPSSRPAADAANCLSGSRGGARGGSGGTAVCQGSGAHS